MGSISNLTRVWGTRSTKGEKPTGPEVGGLVSAARMDARRKKKHWQQAASGTRSLRCAEAHPTLRASKVEKQLVIACDAEAGEGAIGEPPGGLGNIGVGFLPGGVEGGAPVALNLERWLQEGAAFEDGFVAG